MSKLAHAWSTMKSNSCNYNIESGYQWANKLKYLEMILMPPSYFWAGCNRWNHAGSILPPSAWLERCASSSVLYEYSNKKEPADAELQDNEGWHHSSTLPLPLFSSFDAQGPLIHPCVPEWVSDITSRWTNLNLSFNATPCCIPKPVENMNYLVAFLFFSLSLSLSLARGTLCWSNQGLVVVPSSCLVLMMLHSGTNLERQR